MVTRSSQGGQKEDRFHLDEDNAWWKTKIKEDLSDEYTNEDIDFISDGSGVALDEDMYNVTTVYKRGEQDVKEEASSEESYQWNGSLVSQIFSDEEIQKLKGILESRTFWHTAKLSYQTPCLVPKPYGFVAF